MSCNQQLTSALYHGRRNPSSMSLKTKFFWSLFFWEQLPKAYTPFKCAHCMELVSAAHLAPNLCTACSDWLHHAVTVTPCCGVQMTHVSSDGGTSLSASAFWFYPKELLLHPRLALRVGCDHWTLYICEGCWGRFFFKLLVRGVHHTR